MKSMWRSCALLKGREMFTELLPVLQDRMVTLIIARLDETLDAYRKQLALTQGADHEE